MPRESKAERAKRAGRIMAALHELYPNADCALRHANPWQLLIATILSAQCTDARVNMVTPELFQRYPDPRALAGARRADVERLVKSTGFFRNKAKSIQEASRQIVERHGGRVPETMEELTALSGVARKTANVVLGAAFAKAEGVVVDTHVRRLSQRLGLTAQSDPVKIERELMELLDRGEWTFAAHGLILHGRAVCAARKPNCAACGLADDCPSAFSFE